MKPGSILLLAISIVVSQAPSYAAASKTAAKPAASKTQSTTANPLKAIDMSQVKMDAPSPPEANPAGGLSGAPGAPKAPPMAVPPWQANPALQPQQYGIPSYQSAQVPAGQVPQNAPTYSGAPAYGTPPYGAPRTGYPAQPAYPGAPPGYPTSAYPPPGYGAPQYGTQPAYGSPPAGYPPAGPAPTYNYQNPSPGANGAWVPQGRARFGGPATTSATTPPPPQQPQGYAPPGQYQQPAPGYSQPAGYAPGYAPVGYAPPPTGYAQPPAGYGQLPAGYSQPPAGYAQPPAGYAGQPPPGGYAAPPGYGTAPPQQSASSFPNPDLIPEFGKPLPLDASRKGPAAGWTTAPPQAGAPPAPGGGIPQVSSTPYGTAGPGGDDPEEARVSKLEQLAFGSTYPEHEVEDRVDHLEKEIFGEKFTGDMASRIQRLESKLGGRGAFGGKNSGVRHGSWAGKTAGDVASAGSSVSSSPDNDSGPSNKDVGSTIASNDTGGGAAGAVDRDTENGAARNDGDDTTGGAGETAAYKSSSNDSKKGATGDGSSLNETKKNGDKAKIASAQRPVSPIKIQYDSSAGDYAIKIQRFANDRVARWTSFPVRVRFPDDTPPDWRRQMDSGFDKWARYIPLKLAGVKETADIEVSWVNHLVPRVLGVTRLSINGGRMRVQVFMLRPNYYQPAVPAKALSIAFLHELGHALGLFGHSDKPTDIMYTCEVLPGGRGKLTQEKPVISARDLNTLKQLYDENPLPDDFSLPSPMEWGMSSGAS